MSGPYTYPVAIAVPFDGTEDSDGNPVVPPFASENVRDAIIEARDSATSLARFVIPLSYNGTINNNTFIGYLNTIPGDDSPVILPSDAILREYTFSNKRSNADYTLEFRKNSLTATPFHTVSKVNTQFFYEDTLTELFNAGDQIYVKYKDDGQNAQDISIILFYEKVL